jgi:hypothetical protein
MSELHETSSAKYQQQIDAVGWVFATVILSLLPPLPRSLLSMATTTP